MSCFIPGCKSGYMSERRKNKEAGIKNNSFFTARTDEMLQAWQAAIPREDRLIQKKDRVCALHFKESDIEREYVTRMPDGTVNRILKEKPTLIMGAVPSIFRNIHNFKKRKLKSIDTSNDQSNEKKKEEDIVPSVKILVEQTKIVDLREQSTDSESEIHSSGKRELKSIDTCNNQLNRKIKKEDIVPSTEILMEHSGSTCEQSEIVDSHEQPSVSKIESVTSNEQNIGELLPSVVSSTEKCATFAIHEEQSVPDVKLQVHELFYEDCDGSLSDESLFAKIVENLKLIPCPSNIWIPCIAYGNAMWTIWNNDLSAIQKRVVIYQDLTVRVFTDKREITVDGITKIKSVGEVAEVLQTVSMLLPCKTCNDTERVKDCRGYVFKKQKGQTGPQALRCDVCKKHNKASLEKSRRMEPFQKQLQKAFRIKQECRNIMRRNIRLENKIGKLRQKLKAAKEECAAANERALECAISKLPVNQKKAVEACLTEAKAKKAKVF